jgi:uncharacterized protein (PEP-CTERM system associated)
MAPKPPSSAADAARVATSIPSNCTLTVLRPIAAAAMLLAGADTALAQRWFIEPSIGTRVTATSNSTLGGLESERDVVVGIRPRVVIRGDTPALHVLGSIGVDSVNYTRQTQDDVVLPQADLLARLMAVDRLFYIEGAVRAQQTNANPFGERPDATSTANTVTSTQYRLSPYIDYEPRQGLHVRARSDNTKTNENGATLSLSESAGRAYLQHHTASVEQVPRPFGWRFEADRSKTRYQGGTTAPLTIDVARVLINFAFNDEASIGLRGGAERNNFSQTDDETRSIYGGQFSWRPSERTALDGDAERRFFGTSWHLGFTHRSPLLAWSIRAARDFDTTPISLLGLPATDNVAGLLDAILTTRFPNPIDRAKQVQDLMRVRGLPSSLSSPISIIGPRVSISKSVSATGALLGNRSSVALSVFRSEVRDALDSGPLATGLAIANNRQIGGSLAYSLRLSPTSSATVVVDYSRVEALAEVVGQRTQQAGVRGQFTQQVAAKSFAHIGAEYRKLASGFFGSGHESLAFVALEHTF